jgi:hypothetical protein
MGSPGTFVPLPMKCQQQKSSFFATSAVLFFAELYQFVRMRQEYLKLMQATLGQSRSQAAEAAVLGAEDECERMAESIRSSKVEFLTFKCKQDKSAASYSMA